MEKAHVTGNVLAAIITLTVVGIFFGKPIVNYIKSRVSGKENELAVNNK